MCLVLILCLFCGAPLVPFAGATQPELAADPLGIVYVVSGSVFAGDSTGPDALGLIPLVTVGTNATWNQGLDLLPGSIVASGLTTSGYLSGNVTAALDFSPQSDNHTLGTEFRVDVYVRGTSQCYAVQCESSGSISVSRPGSCFGEAGPFVEANWNGQSVGSLEFCTSDESLTLVSDDCDVSGTSCCEPVTFPGDPDTEYSLAFSKTFSGQVSQTTPGPLATGVPIRATLDVDFTISGRGGCGPAPDVLNVLSFSRDRAGVCNGVERDFLTGNSFTTLRAQLADPANFGPDGIFPSAITLVPPVDSLTADVFQDVDIFFLGPDTRLAPCEQKVLGQFVAGGGGLFAFENSADLNAGSIFGAVPGG